uniref:Uncharacterized protein n=1 Tax=Noccaea caerulescens TaxID=107243 RepID=A0A1J3E7L1_NOCCA
MDGAHEKAAASMKVVMDAFMCLRSIIVAPSKLTETNLANILNVDMSCISFEYLPSNMYANASAAMKRAIFETEDKTEVNKCYNSSFRHSAECVTRIKSKIPQSSCSSFMYILFTSQTDSPQRAPAALSCRPVDAFEQDFASATNASPPPNAAMDSRFLSSNDKFQRATSSFLFNTFMRRFRELNKSF